MTPDTDSLRQKDPLRSAESLETEWGNVRGSSYGPLAARSTIVVTIVKITATVISLATTMILARLLTESEYGIIDLAGTLTALLAISTDLGLSIATIQRSRITPEQISTLFWLNAAFGFGLWAACSLAGPLLVLFYSEPALYWVAPAVGINFFFAGLAAQPEALLRRQFAFRKTGTAEIAGRIIGLGVGVGAALAGLSYWALVLNTLTTAAVRTVILFVASRFRPTAPRRGTGVRPMITVGGWYVGFSFLNYFSRNLDNVIIGKVLGKAALGFYARAYRLYLLPQTLVSGILGQVALPALSRLTGERERFLQAYLSILQVTVLTGSAVGGWLAVLAPEAILVVLGERWLPAVPIFRIFAAVGVLQPILSSTGWIYTSLGRTDRMFRWSFVPAILLSAGFAVGVHYGTLGVAWAYAIVWIGLLFLPGLAYCLNTVPIGLGYVLRRLLGPLGVVVISTVGAFGIRLLVPPGTDSLLTAVIVMVPTLLIHFGAARLLTRSTLEEIKVLLEVRLDGDPVDDDD